MLIGLICVHLLCLQLEACESARMSGSDVQHPLLDRVRQCSAHPDQAAAFFSQLFHPVPHLRGEAVDHIWIASTMSKMCEEVGIDYWALSAAAEADWLLKEAAEADRLSKAKQGCMSAFCASLFPCFGGSSSTLEADTYVPGICPPSNMEGDSEKQWSGHKNAASAADKPGADSTVKPYSPNRRQTWGVLKKPFAGRSKHSKQQVHKASARSASVAQGGSPGEAAEAELSAMSTAVSKQQLVRDGAVSMVAATGTAVEVPVQMLQQQEAVRSHYDHGLSSKTDCSNGKGTLLNQHGAAAEECHGHGAADAEDLQKAPEGAANRTR